MTCGPIHQLRQISKHTDEDGFMENVYLLELIACMEREIEEHSAGKYIGCEIHSNCNERFQSAINRLKDQYSKQEFEGAANLEDEESAAPSPKRKVVRGEESEGAMLLEKLANELDRLGITEEAELARVHARELLASQLNEFDGFNYDAEEKKKGPAVVDPVPSTAAAPSETTCRLADGP